MFILCFGRRPHNSVLDLGRCPRRARWIDSWHRFGAQGLVGAGTRWSSGLTFGQGTHHAGEAWYPGVMSGSVVTPETLALREILEARSSEFRQLLQKYAAVNPRLSVPSLGATPTQAVISTSSWRWIPPTEIC